MVRTKENELHSQSRMLNHNEEAIPMEFLKTRSSDAQKKLIIFLALLSIILGLSTAALEFKLLNHGPQSSRSPFSEVIPALHYGAETDYHSRY